jgi:succinate dehydrogenase / fumarate reductase iron-sulfur subunit
MNDKIINVKIARSSVADEEKRIDTFAVPHAKAMTILSMLRYVNEHLDPSVAFRDFRCGRGVCNTCLVRVNGKAKRMCETPVQPGVDILIEPTAGVVIKDLVVDFK